MNKWWWLAIILAIICVLALVIPRLSKFIVDSIAMTINPYDKAVETLDKELADYANGGFTFKEITNTLSSGGSPIADDQIIPLNVLEYSDIGVVIYYRTVDSKGNVIYPNLFFRKINGQLLLDGFMNAYLSVPYSINWIGSASYRLDQSTWYTRFDIPPQYECKSGATGLVLHEYNNIASMTDNKIFYWKDYKHNRYFACPSSNEVQICADKVAKKLAEIIETYFFPMKNLLFYFDTENNSARKALSSVMNYVYQNVAVGTYNQKVLDVSQWYYYPISEADREKYPIDYSNWPPHVAVLDRLTHYIAYDCRAYFDVTYVKKNVGYITQNFSKVSPDNEEFPTPVVDYRKINVALVNRNGVNINSIPISSNPVKIVIENSKTTKTLVIDDVSELNTYCPVVLEFNSEYTYKIESDILMFDNYEGNFIFSNDVNKLELQYDYYYDRLLFNVGLNAIGDIDFSAINLAITPVKIIFDNGQTAIFNSNESFHDLQVCYVRVEENVSNYELNYSILSDALEFASNTGTIIVSATERNHYFNCAGKVKVSLDLSYSPYEQTSGPAVGIGNLTITIGPAYYYDNLQDKDFSFEVSVYNSEYVKIILQPVSGLGLGWSGGNAYLHYELRHYNDNTASYEYLFEENEIFYVQIKLILDDEIFTSKVFTQSYLPNVACRYILGEYAVV